MVVNKKFFEYILLLKLLFICFNFSNINAVDILKTEANTTISEIQEFLEKIQSSDYEFTNEDINYLKKVYIDDKNKKQFVARYIVQYKHNWNLQDKEILALKNTEDYTVAYYMITHNPDWTTDNIDILKIENKNNDTIAHYLARFNPNWSTNDDEILGLINNTRTSVAHFLAQYNPKWTTNKYEILIITNNYGISVAHFLAKYKKNSWNINNKNILNLEDIWGNTVSDYLNQQ